MYKTIIRFGFFDIQNNQGLGKSYQPKPKANLPRPWLFCLSQEPYPITVLSQVLDFHKLFTRVLHETLDSSTQNHT